jgi:hypothetical protein
MREVSPLFHSQTNQMFLIFAEKRLNSHLSPTVPCCHMNANVRHSVTCINMNKGTLKEQETGPTERNFQLHELQDHVTNQKPVMSPAFSGVF